MASKKVVTLKGFETKPGEPWRAADDYNNVTDAHKKLLAGFLEEALTGENHVNTYTKKRSVTIEQCVALSVDLEMAGVEGAADVVVDNAATLKTRMTALKQLLLGDVDTDEEADDDEVKTVAGSIPAWWLRHRSTPCCCSTRATSTSPSTGKPSASCAKS